MADALSALILRLADLVWGPWTIVLLLATGVGLSVRLRFVQITRLGDALRAVRARAAEGAGGALTPFQAFMTALAASIGTGNIAGVATAIVSGGPGALFWIWVYGFFATAIKFTEAVLGMQYRQTADAMASDPARPATLNAGPMHYLAKGLGLRRLGLFYAVVAGVAALTTTPFSQPNSIALVLHSQFAIPKLASGIAVAVLTWLVIVGGVRAIGRAAEALTPIKVGLYVAGSLVVLAANAAALPGILALVVREALSLGAITGGTAGVGMMVALRYGLARGIYANEAGYGTAAVAYGTARSGRPLDQGLNAVIEVFVVSFGTSTLSALVILVTGTWKGGLTSSAAVAAAFETVMPGFGGAVVAVCTFLFGYTTLIGWAYYGEQFLEYAFGMRVATPYRWLYCLLVIVGAQVKVEVVWAWGDLMNGLQIFPNLVGVIGLSGVAASVLERPRERTA